VTTTLIRMPLALALVATTAACGGSSSKPPASGCTRAAIAPTGPGDASGYFPDSDREAARRLRDRLGLLLDRGRLDDGRVGGEAPLGRLRAGRRLVGSAPGRDLPDPGQALPVGGDAVAVGVAAGNFVDVAHVQSQAVMNVRATTAGPLSIQATQDDWYAPGVGLAASRIVLTIPGFGSDTQSISLVTYNIPTAAAASSGGRASPVQPGGGAHRVSVEEAVLEAARNLGR
jgi:hypothetical protein